MSHYYKLKSKNPIKLNTKIFDSMQFILHSNFIYKTKKQITTSSISIVDYSFETSDFEEIINPIRQPMLFKIRDDIIIDALDISQEDYDWIQKHGIFVNPIDKHTKHYIDFKNSKINITWLIEFKKIFKYQFKSFDITKLDTDIIEEMNYMLKSNFNFKLTYNLEELNKDSLFYDDWQIVISDLIPYVEPDININDEETWSTTSITSYKFNDYLSEQIRSRYAFINQPSRTLPNTVMDTYLPRHLYKNKMNFKLIDTTTINNTAIAISPFVARIFNIKQLPIEQLIKILGYTKANIRALLLTIKKKQLNFVFVGAGGTGINTAYWLSQLTELTYVPNLFKQIVAYDEDNIEVSNLFRFPIDPFTTSNSNINKLILIKPLIQKLSNNTHCIEQFIATGEDLYDDYPSPIFNKSLDITKIRTKSNTILYGAPELETRERLSQCGNFISAIHSDNSCHMSLNPKQDLNLQVESYGMIQLAPFFMNQLQMAITLLETLANDSINLMEQDKELLNFSFDGDTKIKTDRVYHFQIENHPRMMEPRAARNF